jgi:hypothetical protein
VFVCLDGPARVACSQNGPRPCLPHPHCLLTLWRLCAMCPTREMDPALLRAAPTRTACPYSRDGSQPSPCRRRPYSRLPLPPRSIGLLRPLLRSVPPTSSTPVAFAPLRSIEIHTNVKFRVDEPPFLSKQRVDVALESACYRRLFQVFHMFQRYVASVSYGCCKSR